MPTLSAIEQLLTCSECTSPQRDHSDRARPQGSHRYTRTELRTSLALRAF